MSVLAKLLFSEYGFAGKPGRSLLVALSGFLAIALAAIIASGLAMPLGNAANLDASPKNAEASPPTAIFFTVYQDRIEPKEIMVSAGRYLVGVDNRSGSGQVVLSMQLNTGQKVADVSVSRAKRDWRRVLAFTSGEYVLSDSGKPGWNSKIIVTGN